MLEVEVPSEKRKRPNLGMPGSLIYKSDFDDIISPIGLKIDTDVIGFFVPFDSLCHFDQINSVSAGPKIHLFQVIPLYIVYFPRGTIIAAQ